MTEINLRALVVSPASCVTLVDELFGAGSGEPAIAIRVARTADEMLRLLDEYRFDVEVFVDDGTSTIDPDDLPDIPQHLRLPCVRIATRPGLAKSAHCNVVLDGSDDRQVVERAIRDEVDRARAVHEGGTPEQIVLDSAKAILWRADPETFEFSFVSEEADAILGYPARDWLGDPKFWVDRIYPEDRETTVKTCVAATARGEDHEFDYRMVAADGRIVWIRDIVRVVEVNGRREIVGVMIDITEAKQIEAALRSSENRFRQVTDAIEEVFWLRDGERALYVSPAYEKIWGRSPQELYDDAGIWFESIHPDDRALLAPTLGRPPSAIRELTFRIVRPDGEIRWVHNRSFPVRDESGNPYRMAGIARDISDLVAANEKLTAIEANYQRLLTISPEIIGMLDLDGTVQEINTAGAKVLGRTPEDMIGRSVGDFVHPADIQMLREGVENLATQASDRFDVELRVLRTTGEERWVRCTLVAVRGEAGVTGIHGIGRDVTEAIVRRERMSILYTAMDSLDQAVSITDLETGEPLYRNQSWARLLGAVPAEVMGVNLDDLVPESEEAQVQEVQTALRTEGQWSGRIWRRRKDTGEIVALDTMHGTAAEAGGRSIVLTIMQDASVEIEREKMLRRAERLASLGTLIGGVAHELNNPLHAIRTFAELLLDEERSDDDREMLEMTRREADRAARVVADLRLFARRTQDDTLTREAVDLNEVILHVVNVRSYTLTTRNIEVVTQLAESLPPIFADQREIEQLVFNLFINAEQAVADGGSGGTSRISLSTSGDKGMVVLKIEDTGPGIPQEDLESIFDPFFTTKAPGHGTGLGLSLVHRIVQEHHGEVTVSSKVGRGSTFLVRLPAAPEKVVKVERPVAVQPDASGPVLTILVADDEPAVRKVTAAFLRRRGHRVDTAADGAEALKLIEAGEYDVLISDLRMPGMDGPTLLRTLREAGHPLAERSFFITGDPPADPSTYQIPIIAKPVQMEMVAELAEKLAGITTTAR